MDWTQHTTDPCDIDMQWRMHAHLRQIRQIDETDYLDWLLSRIDDKRCLDIGAVEHDLSYTKGPPGSTNS